MKKKKQRKKKYFFIITTNRHLKQDRQQQQRELKQQQIELGSFLIGRFVFQRERERESLHNGMPLYFSTVIITNYRRWLVELISRPQLSMSMEQCSNTQWISQLVSQQRQQSSTLVGAQRGRTRITVKQMASKRKRERDRVTNTYLLCRSKRAHKQHAI